MWWKQTLLVFVFKTSELYSEGDFQGFENDRFGHFEWKKITDSRYWKCPALRGWAVSSYYVKAHLELKTGFF